MPFEDNIHIHMSGQGISIPWPCKLRWGRGMGLWQSCIQQKKQKSTEAIICCCLLSHLAEAVGVTNITGYFTMLGAVTALITGLKQTTLLHSPCAILYPFHSTGTLQSGTPVLRSKHPWPMSGVTQSPVSILSSHTSLGHNLWYPDHLIIVSTVGLFGAIAKHRLIWQDMEKSIFLFRLISYAFTPGIRPVMKHSEAGWSNEWKSEVNEYVNHDGG